VGAVIYKRADVEDCTDQLLTNPLADRCIRRPLPSPILDSRTDEQTTEQSAAVADAAAKCPLENRPCKVPAHIPTTVNSSIANYSSSSNSSNWPSAVPVVEDSSGVGGQSVMVVDCGSTLVAPERGRSSVHPPRSLSAANIARFYSVSTSLLSLRQSVTLRAVTRRSSSPTVRSAICDVVAVSI